MVLEKEHWDLTILAAAASRSKETFDSVLECVRKLLTGAQARDLEIHFEDIVRHHNNNNGSILEWWSSPFRFSDVELPKR